MSREPCRYVFFPLYISGNAHRFHDDQLTHARTCTEIPSPFLQARPYDVGACNRGRCLEFKQWSAFTHPCNSRPRAADLPPRLRSLCSVPSGTHYKKAC
ncbi:hypothetical protein BgiBS90_009416 [Biomphalaria glabrata]|nr:hypothetical protein BgiBS90_009416 [Biomphalaria glabrata]